MIDRDLFARPVVRLACAALVISGALVSWTLVRALRPGTGTSSRRTAFDASSAIGPIPARVPAELGIAIVNDLFAVDRAEPASPYRLPGEESAAVVAKVAPVLPVVLGTASMGEGRGFATCQLGEGRPVIVRVGDKLGEYTVKSIERGLVAFTTSAGKSLEIPALKTGT
ncbi:MAG: hypothetical protein JWM95_5623 [Gemmatimonadetes bacterium]|nr:hypothetical protein [Gemmatimonadota bacterium]